MKIKLLELEEQYRKIRREALKAITAVCDSQRYILGENVELLEKEIAAYCGAKYAVACASGSDALTLSLMAVGVGQGDRVVTTPYTFFSTAGSISLVGAKPVFVDIDPRTYNIDADKFAALLGHDALRKEKFVEGIMPEEGSIKAVIPVHLYGQCADMTAINKIAKDYGMAVIEDAAQAIGSSHMGKNAGVLGDIACFSFYPTKNLGCFGDGGMLTTDNEELSSKLKMLRVHGSRVRYYHELIGFNSRLDEIQAAILRIKLKYLDKWTGKRKKNAALYSSLFKKAKLLDCVTLPHTVKGNGHVFNQYIVRVKDRDGLKKYLSDEKGIGTEIYYPVPLHLQKCFEGLGYGKGSFPESEKAAASTLALPVYPELKKDELAYVVDAIAGFYSSRTS